MLKGYIFMAVLTSALAVAVDVCFWYVYGALPKLNHVSATRLAFISLPWPCPQNSPCHEEISAHLSPSEPGERGGKTAQPAGNLMSE